MKIGLNIKKEYDVKFLQVEAEVRYWEDATVNDEEDKTGKLIPCKKGELWCPTIDIDSGIIINWKQGTKASIHYKVCDAGTYRLLDKNESEIYSKEGYVPSILCPADNGYGDYIIMNIDENGGIEDWDNSELSDFVDEED
jgi:hypothetical protein